MIWVNAILSEPIPPSEDCQNVLDRLVAYFEFRQVRERVCRHCTNSREETNIKTAWSAPWEVRHVAQRRGPYGT